MRGEAIAGGATLEGEPIVMAEPITPPPIEGAVRLDEVIDSGDGWLRRVEPGERLRITDLAGNQAADTLFYCAEDPSVRYSWTATIAAQRNPYLTTGSVLMATEGGPLATIVADTVGYHDTVGGACARESNVVRYGEHTRYQHACRDTFVRTLLESGLPIGKRDLTANINFFMNVPLDNHGRAGLRRRPLRPRPLLRARVSPPHARADLQLPADQQPVQRLRSDAGARRDLPPGSTLVVSDGGAVSGPAAADAEGEQAGLALRRGYAELLAGLLRVVEIEDPGMLTTVQDLPGRVGLWEVGVPPSGPMDAGALERANRLVGNAPGAAGLEATLEGPAFRIPGGGVIAVCGALVELTVGGRPAFAEQTIEVAPGALVDIGWASAGARIYVAVRGGLAVPDVLGSRSTFIAGRFGGLDGRPLVAGDRIVIGPGPAGPVPDEDDPGPDVPAIHAGRDDPWTLAVHHGPHGAPDILHPEGLRTMLDVTWTVGSHADRTGVRLEGATPRWARADGGDAGLDPSNVTETPYALGAIMVSGETPIIVGPDGPSLGGFAAPLCVALADRWKIGQLRPGDAVRLRPVRDRMARVAAVLLERPGAAAAGGGTTGIGGARRDARRCATAVRVTRTWSSSTASPFRTLRCAFACTSCSWRCVLRLCRASATSRPGCAACRCASMPPRSTTRR